MDHQREYDIANSETLDPGVGSSAGASVPFHPSSSAPSLVQENRSSIVYPRKPVPNALSRPSSASHVRNTSFGEAIHPTRYSLGQNHFHALQNYADPINLIAGSSITQHPG